MRPQVLVAGGDGVTQENERLVFWGWVEGKRGEGRGLGGPPSDLWETRVSWTGREEVKNQQRPPPHTQRLPHFPPGTQRRDGPYEVPPRGVQAADRGGEGSQWQGGLLLP